MATCAHAAPSLVANFWFDELGKEFERLLPAESDASVLRHYVSKHSIEV